MPPEAPIPASPKTSSPAGAVQVSAVQNETNRNPESPFPSLFVQPKLTVGSPDDPYEREADAMADQVMRMPEPGFVQRKCAQCVEEEVQRQPEDQDQAGQLKRNLSNSFIQRKCAECEKEDK